MIIILVICYRITAIPNVMNMVQSGVPIKQLTNIPELNAD